jgi:hypothetical protein
MIDALNDGNIIKDLSLIVNLNLTQRQLPVFVQIVLEFEKTADKTKSKNDVFDQKK